jgi:hypothetical protein
MKTALDTSTTAGGSGGDDLMMSRTHSVGSQRSRFDGDRHDLRARSRGANRPLQPSDVNIEQGLCARDQDEQHPGNGGSGENPISELCKQLVADLTHDGISFA